ncbi:MAG: hypothetical protein R3C03_01135 [Pirellulaceae bacterium]
MELSVLWATDGKGDRDLGVHYFARNRFDAHSRIQPGESKRLPISTQLPLAPLSYRGQIVRINWMVKVRITIESDHEFEYVFPFRLTDAQDTK